jgi:hypothetical protein
MESVETLAPVEDTNQAPPETAPLTDDDSRLLERMAKARAEKSVPANDTKPEEPKPLAPANDNGEEDTDEDKEDAEPKKLSVAERLSERLAARKEKQQAKNEYATMKEQVQQRERALQEYEQKLVAQFHQDRQQFEQERKAWLRDIASNPIKLVTEAGHSADDIIRNIQLSDDPQWKITQQLQRQLAETNEKIEQERRQREQFVTAEQQRQQQYVEQQSQRAHQQAVHTLLNDFASPDKAPSLHRLYDPEEIVDRVQRLALDYQKRTGEVAPLDELAEYAEQQARKRLDGADAPGSRSEPPKVKGNGPRTLSAAAASERRATPRSTRDMTDEEQQEHILAMMAAKRAGRQ